MSTGWRKQSFGIASVVLAAIAYSPLHAQDSITTQTFDLVTLPNSAESQVKGGERVSILGQIARETEAVGEHLTAAPRKPFAVKRNAITETVTFESPEFTLRVRDNVGRKAVTNKGHSVAGSLSADNTWNRQLALSLRPAQLADAGLELNFGTASMRRPQLYGRHQHHGIGEPDQWRELEGWHADFSLSPGSGIVSYRGGIGRTRYRRTQATRFQKYDSVLHGDPEWDSGSASWHRIKTDIPLENGHRLEIFGMLGRRSEDYRDMPLTSAYAPIFPGGMHEIGVRWKGKGHQAFAYRWAVDGPGIDACENSLEVKWKGLDLKWKEAFWSFDLPLSTGDNDRYISNDRSWMMRAKFDISKVLGIEKVPDLMPDTITVRYSRGKRHDFIGNGGQNQFDFRNYSLSLAWVAENSASEFTIDRRLRSGLAGPNTINNVSPDQSGITISALHTFWGDDWDVSLYASYDSEHRRFGETRNWSGGAAWSLDLKGWPKLTVGADYNSFDEQSVVSRFQDRGIKVNAKLDFSRFLRVDGAGNPPSLKLHAYTEYESSRYEDLARQSRAGPTVLITYSKTF